MDTFCYLFTLREQAVLMNKELNPSSPRSVTEAESAESLWAYAHSTRTVQKSREASVKTGQEIGRFHDPVHAIN